MSAYDDDDDDDGSTRDPYMTYLRIPAHTVYLSDTTLNDQDALQTLLGKWAIEHTADQVAAIHNEAATKQQPAND